jgi:hypothetical protein
LLADIEEQLKRANAGLAAYGAGIRELARISKEIIDPIQLRMAQGGERSKEDIVVVEAMTKIVESVEKMLDNVGKALDE